MIQTKAVKVNWRGVVIGYEEQEQASLEDARVWLERKVILTGDTASIYVDGVLVETWNIVEGKLDKWTLP